ncbi:MAG: CPBP family intramembrane metalloprotease [Flavobacteriales bacterium]|nr:CPBP family intramembrane metalloprotease [Flavobacteriales bacterium]
MKIYPNINQSIGITFIIIASMLVFAALNIFLNDLIGKEASMFVYYLVSIGIPFIGFHFYRKKTNATSSYQLKPISLINVLALILITLAIQFGINSPITDLIPMSDWIKQAFMELAEMNGLLGFLTLAVAAPILEEFIFRGIVLDGLLKNTSPWKAILISSLLFGFVHLNPWQFIGGTIIGMFIAWVYYRSHNLWYCILIHFANNASAFLIMQTKPAEELMNQTLVESYGGLGFMLVILPVSWICIYLGIRFLRNRFPTNQTISHA